MSLLSVSSAHAFIPPLLRPIHRSFPIAALDLYSAIRLSLVANWMATGAFEPDSEKRSKSRASALQEVLGILVIVFGGETFLALCTGATPSWLLSPTIPLLFGLTHLILTRTPMIRLLPTHPTLVLELALAIPDAIGRTLLLTQFSILPILHPATETTSTILPPTPSTLLLSPFIIAVPFAAFVFTGTNFFSPSLQLSTPVELKPGGWATVDTWIPVVVPFLFLTLIGPVSGWPWGLGIKSWTIPTWIADLFDSLGLPLDYFGANKWVRMTEEEAIVICTLFTSIVFLFRAVHNLGPKRKAWAKMFGLGPKSKKVKAKGKTF